MQDEQALEAITTGSRLLDGVEITTLRAATGVSFTTFWQSACKALDKWLEFRSYAMFKEQVGELQAVGRLR